MATLWAKGNGDSFGENINASEEGSTTVDAKLELLMGGV